MNYIRGEITVRKSTRSIKKILTVLKDEGFDSLVRKVFKKFIYRKKSFTFSKRNLHAPIKQYKTSNRWRVDVFTQQNIPQCRLHFGRHIPDYLDLFNDGLKSFAAYETGTNEVIGIIWYADSDFYDKHFLRCKFEVAAHQVLQIAGEVSPPYRNTQISVNILQWAWDYWKEHGKDEVFSTTDVTNAPSLKIQFHLNWEEMGKLIHFYRCLGCRWQRTELYTGERFAHFKKKKRNKIKG